MSDKVASAEEMWTTVEASQRLGVPYSWLRQQVRARRVPVQKVLVNSRWTNVAPATAWKDLIRHYELIGDGTGTGLAYRPLHAMLMTPVVYSGFVLAYGRRPRCVVCGKDLVPGSWWRWYVPPSFQPTPGEREEMPELAIGCARGHAGARIFVASYWWIVGEDGVAPRRCEEVAASVVQGA